MRRCETDASPAFCENQLKWHVLPCLALKKQKKCMRSGIEKPKGQ